MDVVLIAPGDREEIYQSLGKDHSAIEPPVWTGLLATFLRNRGFSVNVIDANAENLKANDVANRVTDINPYLTALVCYGHQPSASTQVMPSVGKIARAIKEDNISRKIIMVGGHVAALPEQTLREESVDFVCTGEGPYTLDALLQLLKNNSADYKKAPGIMYWEDKHIAQTNPAPNVTQLDIEMPGIAWDLLPMNLYRAHGWHCYAHPDKTQPNPSLYISLSLSF